jgi:hypothetical protein
MQLLPTTLIGFGNFSSQRPTICHRPFSRLQQLINMGLGHFAEFLSKRPALLHHQPLLLLRV